MVGERLSSSGTRLDICSPVQLAEPTTVCTKTSSESVHRTLKSVSRQSLLGTYQNKSLRRLIRNLVNLHIGNCLVRMPKFPFVRFRDTP